MATEVWFAVCSHPTFRVWNGTCFDYCFENVFIQTPFHTLLAAVSAYFFAFTSYSRISSQASNRRADVFRLLLSVAEVVTTIFELLSITNYKSLHLMLSMVTQIFSWSTHVLYLLQSLRTNHNCAEKKNIIFFMAILLVFVANAISVQSALSINTGGHVEFSDKIVWIPILKASLIFIYTVILVVETYRKTNLRFVEHISQQSRQESMQEDELLNMSSSFHEEICEENANFLSRITFWWVNELMRRGVKSMLKSPSDLFTLPATLSADIVNKNVDKIKVKLRSEEPFKLWKLLIASFGAKFAVIGILKFIADIVGFAGPLLLNRIILYLGKKSKQDVNGFYFASGLFLSTLISSFSITLFNYHITNATLGIKSTLISLIYQKMFKVRSHSLLNAFSIGEVLNFSSTDTDRISSFCPNLLQLFSLPFQLAVSLYLLYTQLGLSFLSGLMFAIVILPINKWICDKIGDLSTKMMKFKDRRIRLMTEILSGIRIIKMHAWEQFFSQRIDNFRRKEMKYMKGRKFLDAVCVYLWATTPVIISWLSFTTFVLLDNKLTSAKVFTSLALFNMLIMPLNALPWVLNGVVEAWVSIKRIQKFLSMVEIVDEDHCNVLPPENVDIIAEDAKFQRESNETTNNDFFSVGPLTLSLKKGSFIGVIGEVGCGKSSLLSAFIGEMFRVSGNFGISREELQKGIGFVPQNPFISNTTIRNNILFGKVYDLTLYNSVLNACALHQDLQVLANGENTPAGDKGASLSGGQKARVALARALYQQFNIYFLDDPFSSLDIHVAKHIYRHCIMEILAQKTRIICTHHFEFLSDADVIYVIKDGKVFESGPPSVILNSEVYRKLKHTEASEAKKYTEIESSGEEMEKEEMNEGVVSWKVYNQYLKAVGWFLSLCVLLSLSFMQISRTFCDWWLAHWTSVIKHNDTSTDDNMHYLEYFAGFAALNSLLTVIRAFLFAIGGIVAAISIHRLMLTSIFSCSSQFFDSKPFGRTITRFSSDMFNIDDALPFTLNIFLAQIFSLFASIAITVYGIPSIAILLLLLVIPYYYIQWFYRWTSRDLKRLCSVTLAPIYSHFAETFYGLLTIRAFNSINRFTSELHSKVDDCNTTQYAANAASQWLNLRLQMLGVLVTGGVAFLAVSLHYFSVERVDAGYIGLALAYSLSITSLLNGVIQTFTQVETDMVSVERVQQYIESSRKESTNGFTPQNWPNKGIVVFENVSMRYKENNPLVLQNVSFKIDSTQFVGIVGRTGSGKSSLFQCLFRLVDPETGYIAIDGIEIHTVQLKTLRSNLYIIPQESFLFTGTLRENIDPSNTFTDVAIWKALRDCNLEAAVLSLGGLGVNLSECGCDLSVGQKQLLCLTRALLSRKKIICLDEATASIDYKTEVVIYQTIRKYFANSTILMIAHKMESVLKCDQVIVMDSGKVAETGPPNDLLNNKQSLLYKMFSSFEI